MPSRLAGLMGGGPRRVAVCDARVAGQCVCALLMDGVSRGAGERVSEAVSDVERGHFGVAEGGCVRGGPPRVAVRDARCARVCVCV